MKNFKEYYEQVNENYELNENKNKEELFKNLDNYYTLNGSIWQLPKIVATFFKDKKMIKKAESLELLAFSHYGTDKINNSIAYKMLKEMGSNLKNNITSQEYSDHVLAKFNKYK